jgi:rod shape-determining protein MreD
MPGPLVVSVRAVVRTLVLIALTLLVQTTVVLDVRIDGAAPDLMLLLPIAAGLVAGAVEGALVGFVAGIAADLLSPTPFGLAALVGTLVGFGVGALSGTLLRDLRLFSTVVALVASAGAVGLYAVLGALLGQPQFLHVGLAVVVPVVAVTNAILAVPAVRLLRWALSPREDRVPAGGPW